VEPLGPFERWRLESELAVVELLPARGALVTRFSTAGDELLFLDEATVVDTARSVRGGIPILWPNAGALPPGPIEREGAPLRLTRHGFARDRAWTVAASGCDERGAFVRLTLEDDDATRAVFPFAFRLELELLLQGAALTLELRVQNRGDRPLPHAPGYHPYFRVPQEAKERAEVESDATTAWDNRRQQPVALGQPDLTADELDWHYEDHALPGTLLRRPPLRPVRLTWSDGFETLVVWTLGGQPFVCVEPWSAPAGAIADERARVVAPGAVDVLRWSLSV